MTTQPEEGDSVCGPGLGSRRVFTETNTSVRVLDAAAGAERPDFWLLQETHRPRDSQVDLKEADFFRFFPRFSRPLRNAPTADAHLQSRKGFV